MCNLLQYHFVMVDRFISTAAAGLTHGDPCILGVGRLTSDDFPFGHAYYGKIYPQPGFSFWPFDQNNLGFILSFRNHASWTLPYYTRNFPSGKPMRKREFFKVDLSSRIMVVQKW